MVFNFGIQEFLLSGTACDTERLHILPGINPVNAFGKGEYTRTSEPIENLLAAPLVGDQAGMPQHCEVT
jgi:hypothetical protein